MSYTATFEGKVKKFTSLRALASWVLDVRTRNRLFEYKPLFNGERLDAVDEQVLLLYLTKLKGNDNGNV